MNANGENRLKHNSQKIDLMLDLLTSHFLTLNIARKNENRNSRSVLCRRKHDADLPFALLSPRCEAFKINYNGDETASTFCCKSFRRSVSPCSKVDRNMTDCFFIINGKNARKKLFSV